MFTSLSVSAGVQEFWQKVVVFFTVTVKDFFVNLLQNKPVAFYLIIAGAALLLAGIIALIVVGAKRSKAKKAAKKAKKARAEKAKAQKKPAAAPAAPAAPSVNSDAIVAAENARVQEARKAAAAKIGELQDQLRTCIQALERIKDANAPTPAPAPKAAPAPVESADVADEIAQNIEAMIGSTVDTAPKAAPKHPTNNDTTTSKFASLNLQFGRNYDPTSK